MHALLATILLLLLLFFYYCSAPVFVVIVFSYQTEPSRPRDQRNGGPCSATESTRRSSSIGPFSHSSHVFLAHTPNNRPSLPQNTPRASRQNPRSDGRFGLGSSVCSPPQSSLVSSSSFGPNPVVRFDFVSFHLIRYTIRYTIRFPSLPVRSLSNTNTGRFLFSFFPRPRRLFLTQEEPPPPPQPLHQRARTKAMTPKVVAPPTAAGPSRDRRISPGPPRNTSRCCRPRGS